MPINVADQITCYFARFRHYSERLSMDDLTLKQMVALDRLIEFTKSDTEQARLVADFLLAW